MLLEKERRLSSPRPIEEAGGHECPPSVLGRLEAKVRTFCAIPQVLAFLKDYIGFTEKD
jgi:type I restriction enzyme R subunit